MFKSIEHLRRDVERARWALKGTSLQGGSSYLNSKLIEAQRALDDALTAESVERSAEYYRLHENEPNTAKE